MRLLTLQPTFHPWSSAERLASLRGLFDSAFEPSPFRCAGRSATAPALDIFQDAERVTVRLEVPGFRKEDFDLSLREDTLTVSGERRPVDADGGESEARERFSRVVTLPSPVNAAEVRATYEDGILTVTLPKAEEAKPRRIEVNVP